MAQRMASGLSIFTLLLAFTVTASAAEVGFYGKALMGMINTSNAKLLERGRPGTAPESATVASGKVRLRIDVGTDDGLSELVYGFETGANNFGDEWDYSGDSQDFENRFAYIQSAIPAMGDGVYGRAGLQKTRINHWVWTETAAGLTLHGEGHVNWQSGWYRGVEDDIADDNDDTDLFLAKVDLSPNSNFRFGGFGIYALDFGGKEEAVSEADHYWMGLTAEVGGPVFAAGDLIYLGGEAGPGGSEDVSAYLASVTMGFMVGDARQISVNALYVSGDDDEDDADREEFRGIDADVEIGQIFFKDSLAASLDRFVADQPYKLANGLINLAVEGQVQIDPWNKLRAAARYLASAENMATAEGSEDNLGYEFDLWYAHEFNDNLSFRLEGAYLVSGDLTKALFEDEDDLYVLSAGAVFAF